MLTGQWVYKWAVCGLLFCMAVQPVCAHSLPDYGPYFVDEKAGAESEGLPAWLTILLTPPAEASASITVDSDSGYRLIRADGIANHSVGQFPNAHNPNTIHQQNYSFRVPLHPVKASQVTALNMGPFGIAINGVVFDPGAAEWWRNDPSSGWQYEAMGGAVNLGLDNNNAHVQPTGAYHYHGLPTGLLAKTHWREKPVLIGWAADGFPIYGPYGWRDPDNADSGLVEYKSGWHVKKGERNGGPGGKYDGSFTQDYEYRSGTGDLDRCNGITGVTPEFPDGIYHYVLTADFPYIPRCFAGKPDGTFLRHGPGPAERGSGHRGRRPPPPGRGFPPFPPPR